MSKKGDLDRVTFQIEPLLLSRIETQLEGNLVVAYRLIILQHALFPLYCEFSLYLFSFEDVSIALQY